MPCAFVHGSPDWKWGFGQRDEKELWDTYGFLGEYKGQGAPLTLIKLLLILLTCEQIYLVSLPLHQFFPEWTILGYCNGTVGRVYAFRVANPSLISCISYGSLCNTGSNS